MGGASAGSGCRSTRTRRTSPQRRDISARPLPRSPAGPRRGAEAPRTRPLVRDPHNAELLYFRPAPLARLARVGDYQGALRAARRGRCSANPRILLFGVGRTCLAGDALREAPPRRGEAEDALRSATVDGEQLVRSRATSSCRACGPPPARNKAGRPAPRSDEAALHLLASSPASARRKQLGWWANAPRVDRPVHLGFRSRSRHAAARAGRPKHRPEAPPGTPAVGRPRRPRRGRHAAWRSRRASLGPAPPTPARSRAAVDVVERPDVDDVIARPPRMHAEMRDPAATGLASSP